MKTAGRNRATFLKRYVRCWVSYENTWIFYTQITNSTTNLIWFRPTRAVHKRLVGLNANLTFDKDEQFVHNRLSSYSCSKFSLYVTGNCVDCILKTNRVSHIWAWGNYTKEVKGGSSLCSFCDLEILCYTMADFFYETLPKKDSDRCMFIV